ncbi:hypothetical protein IWX84_002698 [Flavobacterium sp. CG_9.10]|uniref:hypothetical protein n=1 Tax=Flavobacterium sp. CG_9.10 TaxID=2787729 RepID=UPI0018C9E062|nr:hypothetical protein [Flavobacterium sp. CG_9.10]MBG6111810.1 hypothetical protein [Flavobacterium sp. CG_9.10]
MRIIALRGSDRCGKTTTLNIIYKRIVENGGNPMCKKTEGNPIYNDFSDIVNYEGLKVAFFTMGDYSNESTRVIKEYQALNVDVLILASNIKFKKPIKLIKNYEHQLVVKTIATPNSENNQLTANTSDVKTIFGLI